MKAWRFQSAERKDEKYGVTTGILNIAMGCLAGIGVAVLSQIPFIDVKPHPGNVDDSYQIQRAAMPLDTVMDRQSNILLFEYYAGPGPYPESIKRTGSNEWTVIFRNYKQEVPVAAPGD